MLIEIIENLAEPIKIMFFEGPLWIIFNCLVGRISVGNLVNKCKIYNIVVTFAREQIN